MLSSTALVCIVNVTSIVDLILRMWLLECNVCGGITAVVLSRCRSLYLILRDLHGILAIVWAPAYSVVFYLCVLAT